MVTDLNGKFEIDYGLSSNNAGCWRAAGDIILKVSREHIASVAGEGPSIQNAERDLLFKARKYLKIAQEEARD